jgi:uncharacterized protein
MAHYASNKYSYWSQLGILMVLCGIGLVVGGLLSLVPLLSQTDWADLTGTTAGAVLKKLMVPANADIKRAMQFISTLFMFMLPALLYAWLCHQKPWQHLGFNRKFHPSQLLATMLLMLVCLPLVNALHAFSEALPWSKAMMVKFKAAEDAYNTQVMAIARMNNFTDYLVALFIIAILPAFFEEMLFRGALQNLLSRWFKLPVVAIIVTAILFSAIHGSYLGFLSRFLLGFILGWLYYRSGNIWICIFAHGFNNGAAITALYFATKPGQQPNMNALNENFPFWAALLSLALMVVVIKWFNRLSAATPQPGQEVIMHQWNLSGQLFENDFATGKHSTS